MIYAVLIFLGVGVVAVVSGMWAFGRRERKAGRDAERSDAQKEVIDGQAKVQAARVATADSSTGRVERLRSRFTRR